MRVVPPPTEKCLELMAQHNISSEQREENIRYVHWTMVLEDQEVPMDICAKNYEWVLENCLPFGDDDE